MLKEIFCPKLVVSNAILVFLDLLKATMVADIEHHPFSKSLHPPPADSFVYEIKTEDFYMDMAKVVENRFDKSEYSREDNSY